MLLYLMTYSVKSESWGWSQDRVTSLSRTPAILRFLVNSVHYSQDSKCCESGYQCCGSEIRCLFDPWIRDPGSNMVKNQDPDSGWKSQITFPRELRNNFLGLKFLDSLYADPDPGSGIFLILDPGWKKFGSDQHCWIRILLPHLDRNTNSLVKAKHMDPKPNLI